MLYRPATKDNSKGCAYPVLRSFARTNKAAVSTHRLQGVKLL